MRVLAIETVETTGSVALLEDEALLAQRSLAANQGSARALAPAIAELFKESGWPAATVELVAVATGPGSFTGLRIGVTTAKVFAYASGCQVIGVGTMEALAAHVPESISRFSAVVDAFRGELFVADFERAHGELTRSRPTRIEPAESWIAGLAAGAVVTGPGLTRYASQLGSAVIALESRLWTPTAAVVGQMGRRAFLAGERTSPFELVPRYFRRSAAEEKAEGRQQDAKE